MAGTAEASVFGAAGSAGLVVSPSSLVSGAFGSAGVSLFGGTGSAGVVAGGTPSPTGVTGPVFVDGPVVVAGAVVPDGDVVAPSPLAPPVPVPFLRSSTGLTSAAGKPVARTDGVAFALRITKPQTPAVVAQRMATTMVMRVKVSPALAPKALCPPEPPNAPARPPPRPRCRRISTIMKKLSSRIRVCRTYAKICTGSIPFHRREFR